MERFCLIAGGIGIFCLILGCNEANEVDSRIDRNSSSKADAGLSSEVNGYLFNFMEQNQALVYKPKEKFTLTLTIAGKISTDHPRFVVANIYSRKLIVDSIRLEPTVEDDKRTNIYKIRATAPKDAGYFKLVVEAHKVIAQKDFMSAPTTRKFESKQINFRVVK